MAALHFRLKRCKLKKMDPDLMLKYLKFFSLPAPYRSNWASAALRCAHHFVGRRWWPFLQRVCDGRAFDRDPVTFHGRMFQWPSLFTELGLAWHPPFFDGSNWRIFNWITQESIENWLLILWRGILPILYVCNLKYSNKKIVSFYFMYFVLQILYCSPSYLLYWNIYKCNF